MLLIPKPQFWIYIYLFQTDLFRTKFMVSAMTDFDILNVPGLDEDVSRSTPYGVYIPQLI